MFKIYRHFLNNNPKYLARHYWWAYLWPFGVWFFDHQPIINAILFGQYKRLVDKTLKNIENISHQQILQLSCAYGDLTPKLMDKISPLPLYVADIAKIQLEAVKRKTKNKRNLLKASCMNAEHLEFSDNSFSIIIIFFLLHELPPKARANVIEQLMRIVKIGGVIIISEYAPLPRNHFLYKFFPSRWIITKLEPFLDGFWREDIIAELNKHGEKFGKQAIISSDERIFSSLYRVTQFTIIAGE